MSTPSQPPPRCKDLAFARNLIAQMKEGHGRHNSNQQFNGGGHSNTPDRTVGCVDWLKSDPSKCSVGDVTNYFNLRHPGPAPMMKYLPPRVACRRFDDPCARIEPLETWTFERVRFNTTSGNMVVLWKRIE